MSGCGGILHHVQVNSVGGTLYNGAYVCATSKPCLSSSSDQINQIENQMIWAPETVLQGPGWYSWFNSPARNGFHMRYRKETINGIASYGVLTVASYDSGSAIAAPMGINDGGAHIPATSYVWECISLCGQVGAQWIVNNAATVSKPEKINLTSVQVSVTLEQPRQRLDDLGVFRCPADWSRATDWRQYDRIRYGLRCVDSRLKRRFVGISGHPLL